jgi:hypothetical protein
MIARTLLAALALAGCACAWADTYKWVDEKGVTHYSESPPPDGKSTKVEIKPPPPEAKEPAGAANWKEKELDFRVRRLEKERAEQEGKERADQTAAQRTSRCTSARRQLAIYEEQVPVFKRNERGERVYVEDKDRAGEIEKWRQAVRQNCD